MVEYIKSHYFQEPKFSFTSKQEKDFMTNLSPKDNALSIMEKAALRKEVKHFLYDKLGQFTFKTSPAQQMLVDIIIFRAFSDVNNISSLYRCDEFREKWEFGKGASEYERFKQKIANLSNIIVSAYKYGNIDFEVYKQIFGDNELYKGTKQYTSKIASYLVEEDTIKSLRKNKSA